MDTQQQGTATASTQTGTTGETTATQQTQATQAGTATTATTAQTQQAQTSPSVEELQRQLSEQTEKTRLANDSARHWQSQSDRFKQVAVGIAQPQADPITEKVKALVAQGYNEGDATTLVKLIQAETAPLMQQLQQSQQTLQAATMTHQVINAAANDKDYAPLFQDPDIANQVDNELRRCALTGQGNMVTPDYAKAYAETLWVSKHKPWLQQNGVQQTQQVQQTQPRNFTGYTGFQPNYTPVVQQQTKASDPLVDALAQRMAQHAGHKI